MKRDVIERREARTPWSIVAMVIIAVVSLSYLLLIFWALLNAFKGPLELSYNLFGMPEQWRFENFINSFYDLNVQIRTSEGFRDVYLLEMFWWALYFGIVPAVVNTLATALCSYTLAKYKFALREVITTVLIVIMILPIIGALPSTLELTHAIGMYDQPLWIIVSSCCIWQGSWLILVATYKSISWEYAEAALIDGAGHFQIFCKIMLPMSKTALFVLILLKFITNWNDYNTTLVWYPSYPTIAYGLYYFQQSSTLGLSSKPIQLAAAIISAIPSFILFIVFRDKMMNSLTMGGLKG